jgi:GTP-binding protein EngB required for normal cell division
MDILMKPTVVLTGECGVGKSKLVENLTGCHGLASSSPRGHTVNSTAYHLPYLLFIDTPGSTAMKNRLDHSVWTAQALSVNGPVALILVCCEASLRIDNTVTRLAEALETWMPFANNLCPVITKMDKVTWTERDFKDAVAAELGVHRVLFHSLTTSKQDLKDNILQQCRTVAPVRIAINGSNFLEFFNVAPKDLRIMGRIRNEVARFKKMARYLPSHPPDLIIFHQSSFLNFDS